LFFATAVAALGVAAVVAQTRLWTAIFVGVGVLIVVAATIIAICRRRLALGMFSGVAWLYFAILFSDHLVELHTRLPTTVLLIEFWYERHGHDVAIALSDQGLSFDKDWLYMGSPMSEYSAYPGKAQEVATQFSSYYTTGQMLFGLFLATIAGQFAAFLIKSQKTQ
jgi:hypothetical protein